MINLITNNIVGPILEIISSTSFSPIYPASSTDIFTSATPKVFVVYHLQIRRKFAEFVVCWFCMTFRVIRSNFRARRMLSENGKLSSVTSPSQLRAGVRTW
jgi:hypothetical protein